MSNIPPANIVSSIAQTTVTQKRQADKKNVEERKQAEEYKEQAKLSDQQEHEVEDTLETDGTRVRPHDEVESHEQRKHQARPDGKRFEDDLEEASGEKAKHIDVQI